MTSSSSVASVEPAQVRDDGVGRGLPVRYVFRQARHVRASPDGLRLEQEDVVVRGGFPDLCERPVLDAAAWYRAYVATYLERDVRELMAVGSLRDFERLVRAAALRSGSLLNKAGLARDVGVSPPTANAWLSVPDASNQVVLLEPWFSNRTKSVVKSPKLYFADSGLCAFLMGIEDGRNLLREPLGGALWQAMVYRQSPKTTKP